VTYDDIAAIFLAPLAEPIAEPDVEPTPARRLRDALEPIATQGWWSRPAGEGLTALGVDFFPGYVWGRAAALGTPTASVVAATFGVFEPRMIAAAYEAGVASATRDNILAARAAGGAASLDAIADPDECVAIADPLLRAVDTLDGLGRPLFSALRSLAVPSSPGGRLWRAAELVREYRGDAHLAALVGAGLDAVEANVLTERWLGFALGEYSATRGFGADALADAVGGLQARGWMEGNDRGGDRCRPAGARRYMRRRPRRVRHHGGRHLDAAGRGACVSCRPPQARGRLSRAQNIRMLCVRAAVAAVLPAVSVSVGAATNE
jgi:hypothetical protein